MEEFDGLKKQNMLLQSSHPSSHPIHLSKMKLSTVNSESLNVIDKINDSSNYKISYFTVQDDSYRLLN